jgi:Uncharacterized protein conserved in bacteria (DUF2188)
MSHLFARKLGPNVVKSSTGGTNVAARKQYWVQWLQERWKVRKDRTTLSSHIVKSDAVDAGVKAARANTPSSLKICRRDGTVEDERTYGDDPFPPRG